MGEDPIYETGLKIFVTTTGRSQTQNILHIRKWSDMQKNIAPTQTQYFFAYRFAKQFAKYIQNIFAYL